MSDAERLHQATLDDVRELFPEMLEENVETVAQMITGILRARSGQLTKIASKLKYNSKKTSLVDRFRRFVKNPKIIVDVGYRPVANLFLSSLSNERLVFAIDSTKIGGRCICLMLSVQYKTRALPLAWVVFKGRKGHSTQTLQLELGENRKRIYQGLVSGYRTSTLDLLVYSFSEITLYVYYIPM